MAFLTIICRLLPRVATALLHKGSIPCNLLRQQTSRARLLSRPSPGNRVAVAPEPVLTSLRDEAAAVERCAEALGARILAA
jgi:hypothetical protein